MYADLNIQYVPLLNTFAFIRCRPSLTTVAMCRYSMFFIITIIIISLLDKNMFYVL